jgi:hypothetical protein
MRQFFKSQLRSILGWVTKRTLRKHKPVIIAIIGNGSTSIAREVIYAALNEGLPGRRNLELPEAEFSVPITILDYPHYPQTIVAWVWMLIKSVLQLLTIKPYRHLLVLEMQPLSSRMLDYWLNITSPQFVVKVGKTNTDLRFKNLELKVEPQVIEVKEENSADPIAPFVPVAKELAEKLGIDELDMELGLEALDLPEPRVRFWHSKAGGSVIDATYYYFPIRLDSVLEIVEGFEGNQVCFTPSSDDKQKLTELGGWTINPVDYTPEVNDVILLRGSRTKDFPKYKKYLSTHTPFI